MSIEQQIPAHKTLTKLLSRLRHMSDGEGLVPTAGDESVGSNEAALYALHVPFRWVSAFPRYFYRHSLDEVKKEKEENGTQSNAWTIESLSEGLLGIQVLNHVQRFDHAKLRSLLQRL